MPRTLVVLAAARIEDGEHCSWDCPLFSREGGAHCKKVDPAAYTKTGVARTTLQLDGTRELYFRSSLCKTSYVTYSDT
jgi:hypothetical protein